MFVDLEMMELFEELESMIKNASSIPFSQKSGIDKEEVLSVISEIKAIIPEEVKQADWINKERHKLINDAKQEAAQLVEQANKEAENIREEYNKNIEELKKNSEDMVKAYVESSDPVALAAAQLVEQANKEAENIREEYNKNIEELKKNSEDMVKAYVESSDPVALAEEKASEIIRKAENFATEIKLGSIEYAENVLTTVEYNLKDILQEVARDKAELNPNK